MPGIIFIMGERSEVNNNVMKYFKLICDATLIGVATSQDFCRFQLKHRIIISCPEAVCEYVRVNEVLYRDTWMAPTVTDSIDYTIAKVIEIERDEYDELFVMIEKHDEIVIEPDLPPIEKPEPSISEEESVTIEFLKSSKISEMSQACRNAIVNGFEIQLSDGELYRFSLEMTDQMAIQNLFIRANNGDTDLIWHSNGCLSRIFTKNDILSIYSKMNDVITYETIYYNSLKNYINSLKDRRKISNIKYGMNIPKKYRSEGYDYIVLHTDNSIDN